MKRLDVALMMLFTYTAIVPDSEAKLLLFPVLSGIQVIATAWLKPFINNQAEILDMLEVVLGTVRFILFSSLVAQWYPLPFFLVMGSLLKQPPPKKGCPYLEYG